MNRYLSRRGLLKYAGMTCVSLPLIRVLMESDARAQDAGMTRAVFVYYHDGNIADKFFPQQTGRNFTLPAITQPLTPFRDRIALVRGLQFVANGSHEAGAAYCLTGTSVADRRYSIDSFVGDQLGRGYPQKTLRLGVGANFQGGADKYVSYLKSAALSAIQDSPKLAFRELFWAPGLNAEDNDKINRGKKSVLDFARNELSGIKQRLGNAEQQKLQEHLEALRELERRLGVTPSLSCSNRVDWRGLSFPDQETSYPKSYELNERFGQIGAIMTDIMVQALACGVAPVALLQWSHAVSPTQFDFVGGPGVAKGHHDASHYGGDPNGEIAQQFVKCQAWYMEQVSYLLRALAGISTSAGTLLYETVVFVTTEIGDSERHNFQDIACLIAGGGSGRLRTGQSLNLPGRSYNDILLTVLAAIGLKGQAFGDDHAAAGPINQLLG